jgi:hypothetical protein
MLKIFRFIVIVWLGLLAGALMLLGFVFALISIVWSLLRGRKPAVVVVFQNLRHTAKGFRNGTWTAQKQSHQTPPPDIVDVEAHEIRPVLPSQGETSRDMRGL